MWNSTPSPGFKYQPRKKLWRDGQNNVFDAVEFEARSYRHWVYLTRIRGKVVFNAYPYSHSTQNHQRNMRELLKKLKIKIDVTVSMRQSLDSFSYNALPSLYEALFTTQIEMPRARRPDVYIDELMQRFDTRQDAIKALKDSIRTCRQLGAKMPRKDIKALKKRIETQDKSRLDHARAERKQVNELKKSLKPQVNDLSPIDLSLFDKVNDLNNVTLEVSNA